MLEECSVIIVGWPVGGGGARMKHIAGAVSDISILGDRKRAA
jgi:hypothetical protein